MGLGLGIVLVMLAFIAALGIFSMREINDRVNEIVDGNVYKMDLLQDMSETVHMVSRITAVQRADKAEPRQLAVAKSGSNEDWEEF